MRQHNNLLTAVNKIQRRKKMAAALYDLLFGAVLGFVLVVMLSEWAAGCGQFYIDFEGIKHQMDCLILKLH